METQNVIDDVCVFANIAQDPTFLGIAFSLQVMHRDDFWHGRSVTKTDLPGIKMGNNHCLDSLFYIEKACYLLTSFLFLGDIRTYFVEKMGIIEKLNHPVLVNNINSLIDAVTGENETSVRAILQLLHIRIKENGVVWLDKRTKDFGDLVPTVLQLVKKLKSGIEKEATTDVRFVLHEPGSPLVWYEGWSIPKKYIFGLATPSTLWTIDIRLNTEYDEFIDSWRFMGVFFKDFEPDKCGSLQKVCVINLNDECQITLDIPELKPKTKQVINTYLYGPELSDTQYKQLVDTLHALLDARQYRYRGDVRTVATVVHGLFPTTHHHAKSKPCHITEIEKSLIYCFNGRWPTANTSRNLRDGIQLLNRLYRCTENPNNIWLKNIMLRRDVVSSIVTHLFKLPENKES